MQSGFSGGSRSPAPTLRSARGSVDGVSQPSTAAKTERLLNLVIALLSTRRPLTKAQLHGAVPQYQQTASLEAFHRMFERDKEQLRELGIPLVTHDDPWSPEDAGYLVDRREYALPAIEFEAQELAALALAGRAWTHASLGAAATAALTKLAAGGVPLDASSLVGIEPRVRTTEPAFEPVRAALRDRREVRFDYRKDPGERPSARRLQPWGLTQSRGRWYVTGFDLDRQAERVFRLSRIVGPVRGVGRAGGYRIPADHEPRLLARSAEPGPVDQPPAILRVRVGAGNSLRRRARTVGEVDDEWSLIDIDYQDNTALAQEVAGFGPDVVVEAPAELREAVVRLLTEARDRHTDVGLPLAGPRPPAIAEDPRAGVAGTAPCGTGRSRGAGESATDRLARLLTMVPWLLQHPGVEIDAAAERFGVTRSQLESDLALLFVCGTPGHLPDDLIEADWEDGRVYVGNAEAIARPLRLTVDEALTLIVGLRALDAAPGVTDHDAVRGALAKLEAATGSVAGESSHVRVDLGAGPAEQVLADAGRAAREHRRVWLRYQSFGRDEVTEREVDPMRVINLEAQWYLEGWCHRAEEVRLFRLDRVLELVVHDVDGTPPTQARPRDLAADLYQPGPGDLPIVLVTERAAAWVAEYYPVDEVIELGDGRRQVTLRVADPTWVRRLAWRHGGAVAVCAPADLAAAIRAGAEAALSGYRP